MVDVLPRSSLPWPLVTVMGLFLMVLLASAPSPCWAQSEQEVIVNLSRDAPAPETSYGSSSGKKKRMTLDPDVQTAPTSEQPEARSMGDAAKLETGAAKTEAPAVKP
jgi:hypothetical protein